MLTAETSGLHRLAHFYVSSRYCILFYMLLFTMVAAPLRNTLNLSGTLIESLLAASLLTAIMPVDTARSRHALLVLMIVGWLVRIFSESPEHRTFSVMMLVIWTLIGLIAAAAALRFAMRAVKVDSEHLYAALSAYLLGGIYFGLLYWVLEYTKAGTFSSAGEFSQSSAIYFSFVTLATLGYGDIAPRADFARAFAIIEGIGGQLFLAVLVARLVSLYSKPGRSIKLTAPPYATSSCGPPLATLYSHGAPRHPNPGKTQLPALLRAGFGPHKLCRTLSLLLGVLPHSDA